MPRDVPVSLKRPHQSNSKDPTPLIDLIVHSDYTGVTRNDLPLSSQSQPLTLHWHRRLQSPYVPVGGSLHPSGTFALFHFCVWEGLSTVLPPLRRYGTELWGALNKI